MRRARPLLGTYVEIEAEGLLDSALQQAIDKAFQAIELTQRLMSFHCPDSDLSKLNRRAALEPVSVHPWTAKVLRRALTLYRATDGLFDCAVGYELTRWGLLPDDGLSHLESGSLSSVRLLPDGRIAFTNRIALDFAGIAKGFAVDRAISVLRRHGVRRASVNAGGDMRVIGDEARLIYIRHPTSPKLLSPAGSLQNGAIATSGAAATRRSVRGCEVSALVASKTRKPVIDGAAYSVVAPTCVVADALTKVLVQVKRTDAACFATFGAVALVTPPRDELRVA
ncbi:MAG: FAD:protein FMN transferase [Methylocystis sp.]